MKDSFYTSVLVAAAGKGTRMSGSENKLFELLSGRPVIEWTLRAFEIAETVSEIIVITNEENLIRMKDLVTECGLQKVRGVIQGGKERADSVKNGLQHISPECRFISIHDGARPFITKEEIDRLHRLAYREKAVCCGTRIFDTVKKLAPDGTIVETIDRNLLGSAQTPQIFAREIYEDAVSKAGERISGFTDDASIVSAAGYPVRFEFCRVFNMKLTSDEDLIKGRAYLEFSEK